MRFHIVRSRLMRLPAFRASRAGPPSGAASGAWAVVPPLPPLPPLPPPLLLPPLASGEWGIGHPTVESQRAGLEHLIRITLEQSAARRRPPAGRAGAGDARDRTSGAYRHS